MRCHCLLQWYVLRYVYDVLPTFHDCLRYVSVRYWIYSKCLLFLCLYVAASVKLLICSPPFILDNHKFIFYICESVSVLWIIPLYCLPDPTHTRCHDICLCLTCFPSCADLQVRLSCCCKRRCFVLLYGWLVFRGMCITSSYPFLCRRAFGLFPRLGYREQCFCEHRTARIFLNYSFVWIYAQE